eukprot:316258-Pleurochrysis_carterae.AAC.5
MLAGVQGQRRQGWNGDWGMGTAVGGYRSDSRGHPRIERVAHFFGWILYGDTADVITDAAPLLRCPVTVSFALFGSAEQTCEPVSAREMAN